jgi:hypothetical protein
MFCASGWYVLPSIPAVRGSATAGMVCMVGNKQAGCGSPYIISSVAHISCTMFYTPAAIYITHTHNFVTHILLPILLPTSVFHITCIHNLPLYILHSSNAKRRLSISISSSFETVPAYIPHTPSFLQERSNGFGHNCIPITKPTLIHCIDKTYSYTNHNVCRQSLYLSTIQRTQCHCLPRYEHHGNSFHKCLGSTSYACNYMAKEASSLQL